MGPPMRDGNTPYGRKKVFFEEKKFFIHARFREEDNVGACCNIARGVGCNTITAAMAERVRAWDTLTMFEATVWGRS